MKTNQLKHLFLLAFATLMISSCSQDQPDSLNLIPRPAELTSYNGFLKIDSTGLFRQNGARGINYEPDASGAIPPEGYLLEINKGGITLKASDQAGRFYGEQTLRQLYRDGGFPYVTITDRPRFSYRGLHMDVSRHFFPKEFVKKVLDEMAFYKLNTFHWHLTDGAGWRIQIDQYPLLTQKAAFRDQVAWSKWWYGERLFVDEGTPGAYGGYFTKEDVREIVAYAAQRHITIIPEIEMPGHSEEIFVAYPELSCSGKPYVDSDFCIGNEQVFTFLENVLDEVIELFPSQYIHIGGDEASKAGWKTCPKCKKRMAREGLKDVDELQSYMIKRMEKYLHAKGRRLMGWDEILEGGLAPDATVMSWRGEEGGIQAARQGHDVVMTPNNFLYFDYYQADPVTQPEAIGGFVPIKKAYSYDPVPAVLSKEEKKHILGVQANNWAEYIPDEKHWEYMVFPRMLALAEIAWTPQEQRCWSDFKPRMNAHIPLLHERDINAFNLSDDIEATMQVDTVNRVIEVKLDAEKYPVEIRYTTDGTIPDANASLYTSPIVVTDSASIYAAIFKEGVLQGKPTHKRVDYHRAINKPVYYNSKLYNGYMAGGMSALVDGYRGGLTYMDGLWQGYLNDLDCVVDMEEATSIEMVSIRFMQLTGPEVFQPGEVRLLLSDDGVEYRLEKVIPTAISTEEKHLAFQEYLFRGDWKARYIRIQATEVNKGFIFTDEIVVW